MSELEAPEFLDNFVRLVAEDASNRSEHLLSISFLDHRKPEHCINRITFMLIDRLITIRRRVENHLTGQQNYLAAGIVKRLTANVIYTVVMSSVVMSSCPSAA